ncbi:3-hydroxydecanoyl-[acyl-carrier-protein] dehydratase [Sulfidibacter corallicola]|uniref:Polyketide synthase dehydratase domain-containing protein n=1 Tax=Sulfidibacter corallicola TaxID=2818388 RepID=A0A8A4TWL4_SULCO|nr:beta-ketoacyl synthase N-terminal-like domain-containing protein [Sulfidibacter corallicola]QTD53880.1 polyketide synthase dehydratase domain-containing protein [Sulfidibacter corallicola]
MTFAPIAIVGQACVLPGALSPDELWRHIAAGRDLLASAPPERWRARKDTVLCKPDENARDRTWSDRGGYVSGFEQRFDPTGFALSADYIAELDPLVHWLLHCGREALGQTDRTDKRVAAVFGNLSFPTTSMVDYAIHHWMSRQPGVWRDPALLGDLGIRKIHPHNRFMSGLPAHLLAQALQLEGGAYALDAACASALYAIKLACDQLHDGRADLVLAGGVNRSDDLFIHMGFCALGALSKTGRSRPFHAEADGLIPAEGCALVALKRLDDAVRDGDTIAGVIRGVGLSNDGRGRGLLAPSASGQARAIHGAYRQSGIAPERISLLECHATGTRVGDATELSSLAEVFGSAAHPDRPIPIGSLKSNLGHLITVAGAAGLIKVLGAMAHQTLPPTLHAGDAPNPALADTPFRLQTQAEPWHAETPRLAGISAFGFGGNNAHLIVEEYVPGRATQAAVSHVPTPELAVVALGVSAGACTDTAAFADVLFGGSSALQREDDGSSAAPSPDVALPLPGLKFPPKDFQQTLTQQSLMLRLAREVLDPLDLPLERSAILVGMGADNEVTRYGLRWSLADWAAALQADGSWADAAREEVLPALEASGVLGTMPNIPANRLSSQFDLGGPGFTVSAEELSGLRALEIGARALRTGEVDAAVIAAVDLCCESVHRAALAEVGDKRPPGDAAVMLVLKRLDDARTAGDRILATLPAQAEHGEWTLGSRDLGADMDAADAFGHTHAAAGLLNVAGAVLSTAFGLRPRAGEPAVRWDGDTRRVRVAQQALGSASAALIVGAAGPPMPPTELTAPQPVQGPTVTLAAHPSRIELPKLEQQPMSQSTGTQQMQPAPWLPPVIQDSENTASRQAAPPEPLRVPESPVAPAPATATFISAESVRPEPNVPTATLGQYPQVPVTQPTAFPEETQPSRDVEGVYRKWHSDLTRIHQQFVASQTQAHRRFLEMRRTSMDALLQMQSGMPIPAPVNEAVDPAPSYHQVGEPAEQASSAPPLSSVAPTSLSPSTPPAAPQPIQVEHTSPKAATRPVPTAPAPSPAANRIDANTSTPITPETAAPKPAAAPSSKAPEGFVLADPNPKYDKHKPELLPGPSFSRADLEVLAGGKISSIFGPEFEGQDGYHRQVRMPEPPLLLADRVTGIDAVAKSMGKGTIWTETDVTADRWYLHTGRMPAGVFIESGQADLLLISWLGIDFHNKSERIYRLLGCDLTYHGPLPAVGETLRYDIHLYGHAKHGDTRLMFFKYDCHDSEGNLRMSVRNGQAGFFSDQELDQSAGILWTPEEGEHDAEARLDVPVCTPDRNAFTADQIRAWSDEGNLFACMGPGFELAQTHNRTPAIQGGRMLFLDQITELSYDGGPWRRGYLRARQQIKPDLWFFDGHFKNDPCMPGTLMFEGCLQAMAFYMASLGYTLDKDGWRFEPVEGETIEMRCRGQVTPESQELTYELFVEEIHDGPFPTIYADLLCTCDGLKAFHARRCGLRLVPDWPLTTRTDLVESYREPKPVAEVDGFSFDYRSLLACAWDKASNAFGPMYARFDNGKVPRLPGPPYHFMSRITEVTGKMGGMENGSSVTVEYDIPESEWYFSENGWPTMPFAVLLEAALQPCGWLASYIGSALTSDDDLFFRNLDGDGHLHEELLPGGGPLVTHSKLTNISKAGDMIIVSFDVTCTQDERPIYDLKTVFGFFPKEALANQVGLPETKTRAEAIAEPSEFQVDLTERPAVYCSGAPRLPQPMLLMLDRVTGYWPEGGSAGLGKLRGEKDVDPAEWFFKAHFFQDPVQPGSLGLEALIQLLQFYMIEKGMGAGIECARFEPLALGHDMVWRYRGQVVPRNRLITSDIEITEIGHDADGHPYAICDGWLWCDGRAIYGVQKMGMRIVPSDNPPEAKKGKESAARDTGETIAEFQLDPKVDTWLMDHRPTWTLPAVPLMSMADYLAQAVAERAGQPVVAIEGLQVHRWLTIEGSTTIRVSVKPDGENQFAAELQTWREAANPALSRFEKVMSASLQVGTYEDAPAVKPLVLADDARPADPYASGVLFHGPGFQIMSDLFQDDRGAVATLDASRGTVPVGVLHPLLLDGVTHMMPHDQLYTWSSDIEDDWIAYPYRIPQARFHGPAPTGAVRCEVLFAGFDGEKRFPQFEARFTADGKAWCTLTLVEVLLPKGPIGHAAPLMRRAFLRDRAGETGVSLSEVGGEETRLDPAVVRASDWLPGTVARIYDQAGSVEEQAGHIVVQEHIAAKTGVHPSRVRLDESRSLAWLAERPLNRWRYERADEGGTLVVRDAGPAFQDTIPIRDFWRNYSGLSAWAVEDLYFSLVRSFLGDLVVEDPQQFSQVIGKPAIYLANHQVGVESVVFTLVISGLTRLATGTLSKAQHLDTWIGRLRQFHMSYPGGEDPGTMVFFEREDPAALPEILQRWLEEMKHTPKNMMAHVEGTRSLSCRQPVSRVSAAFTDLAVNHGLPIVPVWFAGGLPVEPSAERLELPLDYAVQDIYLGRPIMPETLKPLSLKERRDFVVEALNATGPSSDSEQPNPPRPEFAKRVAALRDRTGLAEPVAAQWVALNDLREPCAETTALIEAVNNGSADFGKSPNAAWLTELYRYFSGK